MKPILSLNNLQDKTKPLAEWFQNSKDKHEKIYFRKTKHVDKVENAQGRKSSVPTTKIFKVKGEKNLTRQHETKTKGLPEHTLAHSSAPCLPHHERIGDEYLSKLKK